MKYRIEWVTEVTEHHMIVLDEKDVPPWLLSELEERESGIAEGEFEPDDEEEFAPLVDQEGSATNAHDEVTNRYVSRIASEPPTAAEAGYHPHDGIAAVEYGTSSQAGLASFRGQGVTHR